MQRLSAAIAIALAMLSGPARARAQAGLFGSLRTNDPSIAAVAREDVELRCRAALDRELACAIVVRWELRNDSDDVLMPEIMISWGGTPTAAEVRVGEGSLATELPELRPLRIIVPPHASTTVEMRVDQALRAYSGFGPGSDIPSPIDPHDPLAARHPLVAQRWEFVHRGLAWVRPSPIHWASIGPTTIRVHPLEHWELASHAERVIFDRTEDGVRVISWEPAEADSGIRRAIGVELSRGIHTDLLRNGGPFLAIGGTIQLNESDNDVRGRLGYELGLGEWVLVGASVETDFVRQVVITPLLEIASYSLLLGPSFAAGIGLPVEVAGHADVRAGLRLEASAVFYSIGFVSTFDYWPSDGTWQVHLLGRIGL